MGVHGGHEVGEVGVGESAEPARGERHEEQLLGFGGERGIVGSFEQRAQFRRVAERRDAITPAHR